MPSIGGWIYYYAPPGMGSRDNDFTRQSRRIDALCVGSEVWLFVLEVADTPLQIRI